MTSAEIRDSFLRFFRDRGHTVVRSAPVIPAGDPTLLFTNAGMNQFKDVFLGTGSRPYSRAADSQKCIRVSGKHNDLEEVGRDTYHHTFFEMLGNWSFGDYYKREAIEWAWELLTGVWGLGKDRLFATVFESDDEAAQEWRTRTDIDPAHILRFGRKDNFWEMGETGPCGPCSEIHIDLTEDRSGASLVNTGDPRVMEIWNLVFIQYDRDGSGELHPLPARHVDTGMGFERITAVLQGKRSNYDTDIFMPLISEISRLAGTPYTAKHDHPADIAMRVIADHARMLTFSLSDGGVPSNEGRGYVIRRILRRASRFGRNIGLHEPFLWKVVTTVCETLGTHYPEILGRKEHTENIVRAEEESFNVTLDRGLELFDQAALRLAGGDEFPAREAFKLYDTYGFPFDLTRLIASERGLRVDETRFDALMEEQRALSRAGRGDRGGRESRGDGDLYTSEESRKLDLSGAGIRSAFTGYTTLSGRAPVLRSEKNILVVGETPFYAEAGGQVGDAGIITIGGSVVRVVDTQKSGEIIVHLLERPVTATAGETAGLSVDGERRSRIAGNHTATHLVHEALRRVLGEHLHQQGSLVTPERLRFDFNHPERITADQIRAIESMVNEKIAQRIGVAAMNDPAEWLSVEEAKIRYPNVKMFFGERYGDRVRIVEIDPDFSVELCGGTHTANTSELSYFKIVSESGIASGIRRIEAVTGEGFEGYIRERIAEIGELDARLEVLISEGQDLAREMGQGGGGHPVIAPWNPPASGGVMPSVPELDLRKGEREEAIESVTRSNMALRREISRKRVNDAASGLDAVIDGGVRIDGITVVSALVEAADVEELKSLGDSLRGRMKEGVGVLGAAVSGKAALVCVVTDDLLAGKKLDAGKIVGRVARLVGGGGGGRSHLATAGGKDVEALPDALKQVPEIVRSMMA